MTQPCDSGPASVWPANVVRRFGFFICCVCAASRLTAQTNIASPASTNNLLVMIQGKVEVAPAGTDAWALGRLNEVLNPGDHVRTGERSRAAVYLSNGMTIEKGELSEVEIPPSTGTTFLKGLFK